MTNRFREQLAAIEHQRWADWQLYLHGLCDRREDGGLVISANMAAHWERQIATPYSELSEAEKASDLEQVDRYWPMVERLLNALADCVVKATEYGEQDGGFVAVYILPTGPIHRAIPLLQELGITVRPGFDGRPGTVGNPEETDHG